MKDGTKMIVPTWTYLTYADAEAEEAKNRENMWGFTYSELMDLINLHAIAFLGGEMVDMERIEYRLIDANFHREAKLLKEHDYEALREIAFKEFLS